LDELSIFQSIGQSFFLAPLATKPDVADELQLTEKQIERARALVDNLFRPSERTVREFEQLALDEKREKLRQLGRQSQTTLGEILTPAQAVRLNQLALQQRGARAFRDAEIIEKLRLTKEQRARIRNWSEEGQLIRQWLPDKERRARSAALVDRITRELLSQDQHSEWRRLVGEPFNFRDFRGQFHPGGETKPSRRDRDHPSPGGRGVQ
jgi:hypothetical protein